MFLTIKRTIKEAASNFIRNSWLSAAAVSILALSLYISSILYVISFTADNILKNVQNKVNVTVYFKTDIPEEKIMEIKSELERYEEIRSVEYVSREKALEDFKAANADEPRILKSLEEIGDNPLPASLVVSAKSPDKYQGIAGKINENGAIKENVDWINYERDKNREIVERLNSIIATIRKTGSIIGFIFAVVALLITFNSIRITIYTHRREIEIMRLVGASNAFIRLPFVFEGMIYGCAASLASMALLFATLKFITPHVASVISNDSLVGFYTGHFWALLGAQIAIGSVIGIFSSLIAMRRYLKI